MNRSEKPRTSIRRFKTQALSQELIKGLLKAATRAPTAGNLQNYSVILHDSKKDLKDLAEILESPQALETAPVAVTFCVDVSRYSKWIAQDGVATGFQNLWGFMMASSDTFLLAQNFVQEAEQMGLGTCFLGSVLQRGLVLTDYLRCPQGVFPVAILALGHPDEIAAPRERLSVEAILHQSHYGIADRASTNLSIAEKSKSDLKHYLSLGLKFSRLDENALRDLYANRKYPKQLTDIASANLFAALKKQGFC